VQSLIAANIRTHYPDNHVICAISRSYEGRTATVLTHGPCVDDGGRIGCSNAESGKVTAFGVESDIGALIGAIGDSRLEDRAVANLR
jgi:hypothetical protein